MNRIVRMLRLVEWCFGVTLVYASGINALAPSRVLGLFQDSPATSSPCAFSLPMVALVVLVLSQCWVGVSLARFRGFHARASVAGLAMASVLAWTHDGILQSAGDSSVDVFAAAHLLQWSWLAAAVSAALLVLGPHASRGQAPRPGIRRFLKGLTRAGLAMCVASIAVCTAVSQDVPMSGKSVGSQGKVAPTDAIAPGVGQPSPR